MAKKKTSEPDKTTKRIKTVQNNTDKQISYKTQLGKYQRALKNDFCFEAMLIVYAMLEDRMRSFLYYIGAIRKRNEEKINVAKTKGTLRALYFGSEEAAEGKRLDINQISVKEDLIRKILCFVRNSSAKPDNPYLAIIKKTFDKRIKTAEFLQKLDEIDRWRKYRNEVIHGLLNKNIDSLNSELKEQVEMGMEYARFLDSQVKALKNKNEIRTEMRIKN